MKARKSGKPFHCDRLDRFLLQCKISSKDRAVEKNWHERYSEAENGDCAFRYRCPLRDKHCADKGYDGSMYAKICRSEITAKESYSPVKFYSANAYKSNYTE